VVFARQQSFKQIRLKPYRPYRMRIVQGLWIVPVVFVVGLMIVGGILLSEEMHTSRLQANYFTNIATKVNFQLVNGANQHFRVPEEGPYNRRLGYSYLPVFAKSLASYDYDVTQQAVGSDTYQWLLGKSIYPIYRTKTVAGLTLYDRKRMPLYATYFPRHVFPDFASVPPVLTNTLLFVENRELLKDGPATRNPVIEWDRFFFAALGQALQAIVPGFNVGGGSTLATQIEKFRFSPGGQTNGAMDKLRQIASASLRVYLDGPDTREARKKIVLDYLNSTTLSARPGLGEINSIGDGLWGWFGHDLAMVTAALKLPEDSADTLAMKAAAYREVLGLILAQRRPSYYLLTDRAALDELADTTLDNLAKAQVISPELQRAAKLAKFRFLSEPPPLPAPTFIDQKATTALRTQLLGMLGLKNLYELDRIDLTATSTLDQAAQRSVVDFLKKMDDPKFVESVGMYGFRLLKTDNDLTKIKWSVLLYERGERGNYLRVQADNINEPWDMNDGAKLDLGSTAKLRTLVTYLEIIGELHRRYAGLAQEDLRDITNEAPDILTEWATRWLAQNPDAALPEMLEAAMQRQYSGSTSEVFFTGGGAHSFVNFEKEEDYQSFNLYQALEQSVNLAFVRLMRDIVNYTAAQGAVTKQELLSDPDQPARREYLERFADNEGKTFLNRYIQDYAKLDDQGRLAKLSTRSHKGATARTVLFRTVRPDASFDEYKAYMRTVLAAPLPDSRLRQLYTDYPAERFNWSDRGYVVGVHPLELWLVTFLQANPEATRNQLYSVSRPIRIESYAWLFRAKLKGAQDTRIRILLEQDAFAKIHQRWVRMGYPFNRLTPSFATAIGSSGDRPGALAELAGIILNDGQRKPLLRFEQLHFAANTPFETVLEPQGQKITQALSPEITPIVRKAMQTVVDNGTAKRVKGAYQDAAGNILPIGAKTGTGDHRLDQFGPGGRLITSRVINRTGTIVFYIGDRFFGTVSAHVAGEEAADYKFTSALSSQMLKALQPALQPLINEATVRPLASHDGVMEMPKSNDIRVP
jgi:membrane peptidoglycan carboxypeptidase